MYVCIHTHIHSKHIYTYIPYRIHRIHIYTYIHIHIIHIHTYIQYRAVNLNARRLDVCIYIHTHTYKHAHTLSYRAVKLNARRLDTQDLPHCRRCCAATSKRAPPSTFALTNLSISHMTWTCGRGWSMQRQMAMGSEGVESLSTGSTSSTPSLGLELISRR